MTATKGKKADEMGARHQQHETYKTRKLKEGGKFLAIAGQNGNFQGKRKDKETAGTVRNRADRTKEETPLKIKGRPPSGGKNRRTLTQKT